MSTGAISRYGFRAAANKLHVNEQGELIAFGRRKIGEHVKRAYLYRAWTDAYLVRYEPLPGRNGSTAVNELDAPAALELYERLDVQLLPRDIAFEGQDIPELFVTC